MMNNNLTIAVVCHQGLGTSLWLKVQVEKILSLRKVPAQVIQVDIGGLAGMEPDIAIAVSYLKDKIVNNAATCIFVENILDGQGLEKELLLNPLVMSYLE